MDTNVVENTELSTSESVARKMTETSNENFDTEEDMSFDALTIPGYHSYYDVLVKEKGTIPKNDEVWVKKKMDSTVNYLQ